MRLAPGVDEEAENLECINKPLATITTNSNLNLSKLDPN
jgi:hypothetical protein